MRKVVAGLFVSLDGVTESPNLWHFPYSNDEMDNVVGPRMAASDAILLGRVTYQEFAAFWPGANPDDYPGAAYMNDTPKYVVSTTLEKVDWKNSTLIQGDIAQEIIRLKQRPGADIAIIGSSTLVRSLLHADLLDELYLLVHPIVVGTGKHLFPEGCDSKRLQLIDSKTFSTGVLSLTYRPAPPA